MLPNVAVVSGWRNKISVSVSVAVSGVYMKVLPQCYATRGMPELRTGVVLARS